MLQEGNAISPITGRAVEIKGKRPSRHTHRTSPVRPDTMLASDSCRMTTPKHVPTARELTEPARAQQNVWDRQRWGR